MLDPCSGSDNIPRKPLQSSAQARSCLGRGRFPVLHTHREGIPLSRTSRFRPALHPSGPRRGVDLKAPAVSHVPRTAARARVVGPLRRRPISRMRNTRWVRGLGLCLPRKQAFGASCERRPPPFWARPMRAAGSVRNATWLILPVVICLSQRLSHACIKGRHGLRPLLAMIHDNSTDRTALVPATHHSNFCPINFRWVRFRRGSLRNGYHIQGRQQARKLPNPDTGRIHWRASLVPAAAVIPAPIAWTLGWAGRSASGVHRSSRPFCRRCAPGLNWPGRASGAVTLKKLECSKQAYALYTLAWDNIIGFRSYYVGLRDRTFAKDVFINQERKLGARRRSDTVLVSTINDADQGSADVAFRTPPAPYEKSKSLGSGGSMVARLKLKGIDGRAPPGVEPAA
ncbi:UNVERIFIED_CONTAM: hypothetical protein Sindi_3142600 [Sesamum indicum]